MKPRSTPEWEIRKDAFLSRLGLSEQQLTEYLAAPDLRRTTRVVPLRHLIAITSLSPLPWPLLSMLLEKVKTIGGEPVFANASFRLTKVDAAHLRVGQRYAYRENYQALLEGLSSFFSLYAIASGINDLGAYLICGVDKNGASSTAFYLPPIVEVHGSDLVIMDGIHRDFIARQTGAPIVAIVVENAGEFPCGIRTWDDLRVISLADKPKDINERYFDLRKELFRDLKYFGIDG